MSTLIDIGWRAATLDERLTATAGCGGAPEGDEVRARRARWVRLFSGGDEIAWTRRLAWDDLTVDRLTPALTDPAPAMLTAPWVDSLPRLTALAAACARDYGTDGWETEVRSLGGTDEVPFADVWLPCARLFRERLAECTHSGFLMPAARLALEHQLLSEISRAGEQILLERYRAARAATAARSHSGPEAPSDLSPGRVPRDVYDGFVRALLESGLTDLWDGFPALARHVVWLVHSAVVGAAEMLERLATDAAAIAAHFGFAAATIARLNPALSDRHDEGRRVAVLHFQNGHRLVYKPRDIALEFAFNECLAWLRRGGLADVPRSLTVLVRHGYGWVEYAEQAAQPDADAVRAYYRRAGGLTCVAHLLRARDLHGENIIATAHGPSLVDAEALVQPVGLSEGGEDGDDSTSSCLSTGLISLRHQDATGEYYDIGGFRPAQARTAEIGRLAWSGLRSDAVEATTCRETDPVQANGVTCGETIQAPDAFVNDLVEGYEATHRFIDANRDELASVLIASLAGHPTRLLFRPSDRYATVLRVLDAPAHWRSGVDRSIAFDALNRVFCREPAPPPLWPLVAEERHALERADLPRFSVSTSARDLVAADGGRITGHYRSSGAEAVARRLAEMSEDDLDRQSASIRGALRQRRPVDLTIAPRHQDALVAAAEAIGEELLAAGVERGGGLEWPVFGRRLDLYGGAAGPALFLSALAGVCGSRWLEPALASLSTLRTHLADNPLRARGIDGVGAGNGVASVVYALTVSSGLLGDPSWLAPARTLAGELTDTMLDASDAFDLVGGLAGALVALLTLHDATGESEWLDRAAGAGRLLIRRQRRVSGDTAAWASPDGRLRAGFAHGAAGAAYALARLATATGSAGAARAAADAVSWERAVFSPADGNWPSVRSDGGTTMMTAWCHGAAGIALGRALMRPMAASCDVDALDADIRMAAETTGRAGASRFDHLCCGTLSRAEALLVAGRSLQIGAWIDSARRLAEPIAVRVQRHGAAGAHVAGFEHGTFQPGFFQGLSGIGFELLRVSDAPLPSVAGFESVMRRA
ncbi:MAG TPA: type 2 lanthipeptide synthetase LanM family protein [Vicinamibacterales bacterium]|jgi:type 2 lantibiotic biosynthesis protein LanM